MIKCPNRCRGGLVKQKILVWKRLKSCPVCKGRGFIVDVAKFYSKFGECFKNWDLKIEPKGGSKYLVEVFDDER